MEDASVEHEKDYRLEKLEDDPQILKAQAKYELARCKVTSNIPKGIKAMKELPIF